MNRRQLILSAIASLAVPKFMRAGAVRREQSPGSVKLSLHVGDECLKPWRLALINYTAETKLSTTSTAGIIDWLKRLDEALRAYYELRSVLGDPRTLLSELASLVPDSHNSKSNQYDSWTCWRNDKFHLFEYGGVFGRGWMETRRKQPVEERWCLPTDHEDWWFPVRPSYGVVVPERKKVIAALENAEFLIKCDGESIIAKLLHNEWKNYLIRDVLCTHMVFEILHGRTDT